MLCQYHISSADNNCHSQYLSETYISITSGNPWVKINVPMEMLMVLSFEQK